MIIPMSRLRQKGFTMLEMMTAFTVVAVITIVAVPAYRDYVNDAYRAESMTHTAVLEKAQMSYFASNDEFRWMSSNPCRVPNSKLPIGSTTSGCWADHPSWVDMGYPIGKGSMVKYSYEVYVGQTDLAGTEISRNLGGGDISALKPMWTGSISLSPLKENNVGNCINSGFNSRAIINPSGQSKLHWALIYASANMYPSTEYADQCSRTVKLLTYQAGKFTSRPFIYFSEERAPASSGTTSSSGSTSASSSTSSSSSSSSASSSSTSDSTTSSSSTSASDSSSDTSGSEDSSDSKDTTGEDSKDTTGEDSKDTTGEDSKDTTGEDSKDTTGESSGEDK